MRKRKCQGLFQRTLLGTLQDRVYINTDTSKPIVRALSNG